MKLTPLLACAIGFGISHNFVMEKYNQLMQDIKNEKFDLLDELHHLTSGMKSVYSQIAQDGIFQIRQSIGGAGYSAWGGIVNIIDEFSPVVTYEGDNTVMAQQCSRYLMKCVKKVQKGETVQGVYSYLNKIQTMLGTQNQAKTAEDYIKIDQIDEAL